MKKTILLLAFLAATLGASAQTNSNCVNPELLRGIGPAINVNNNPQYGTDIRVLPENAQTFINNLFPDVLTASVENNLKDKEWEVKMADGYEVTFDYAGNWLEVESPRNVMLSSEMVKQLVPQNVVVETLAGDAVVPGGVINFVEEIDYIPGFGYVVEYAAAPQNTGKVAIDTNGNVKSMKDVKAYKASAKKDCKAKGQYAAKNKKGGKKGGKRAVRYNPELQNWTQAPNQGC